MQLTLQLREGLQGSSDESNMLSCSVLEEPACLPELDLEAQGVGREELEALLRLQTVTQARLANMDSMLAAMEKLFTPSNFSCG